MEGGAGRWAVRAAGLAAGVWLLAAGGCGGSGTVRTDSPERAFAPLVTLDRGERWLPVGADWFLARSVLGFAEDEGCPDRKIAVGRRLRGQWTPEFDWIAAAGLGRRPAYWRESYDGDCEALDGARHYANEHTRPFDRDERARRVRLREGYYLDLMDWARGGQPLAGEGGERTVEAPVYVERRWVERGGQRRLWLVYWMLYGMNAPLDGGRVGAAVHEGDWERVDVLVAPRGDDEWEPLAVRLRSPEGVKRVGWDSLPRIAAAGGDATHPVLAAAAGTHELRPVAVGRCGDCPRWPTWASLERAPRQPWYGFGGAWGEVGDDSASTGPVGPYRVWQTGEFQAPPGYE